MSSALDAYCGTTDPFDVSLSCVEVAEQFGIIDNEQNEIVEAKYTKITSLFVNKGNLILQDEKFHLFDLDTKTITANNLDDIYYDHNYELFFFFKLRK